MRRILYSLFVTICFLSLFTGGCKEEFKSDPVFSLKKTSPYLYKDTMLHLYDSVTVGVIAKAIGEKNKIKKYNISKNDDVLLDTNLNKQTVFIGFELKIDTLDSIDYTFKAYDIDFNFSEYKIKTFYQFDTFQEYIYDTLADTVKVVTDSIETDSISMKINIVDSIQIIDTLFNIDL